MPPCILTAPLVPWARAQEAFDEMDAALSNQTVPASHGARDDLMQYVSPTQEEQAWLDSEYDELIMQTEAAHGAAVHDFASAADVLLLLRRLLALHPALDVDEARWLYQRERSAREGAHDCG